MLPSTPFKSSAEIYEWISQFINFERGNTRRNFSLDRMKILAELSGHPENCAPLIHVAGSKGKGSVTGMIAAILEASGLKTARYSSPHVSDFRERLSLASAFFDEEIYAEAGMELMELVESLSASANAALFDRSFQNGEEPTFFELMTLWFFLCARKARCGAMAVETGMGGRLDSTNIVEPLASVITVIELEHTEYLGKTIAAIAGEKAGIIKKGKPLILAEQKDEALEVFRERAALSGSPLLYFPECAEVKDIKVSREGTSFTLVLKNARAENGAPEKSETETFPELFVPLPGEVQAKNAGLAILALKTAFPQLTRDSIYRGLAAFSLPARFERIRESPPVIIDGAHTKRSVEICVNTFTSLYGSGGILIFGCAEGKDVLSMAELCVPFFSTVIITRPGTFKKSQPEEIYSAFAEQKEKKGAAAELILIPDTEKAIDRAIEIAAHNNAAQSAANNVAQKNLPVLGTGSFYLAGEIRARLKLANDTGCN